MGYKALVRACICVAALACAAAPGAALAQEGTGTPTPRPAVKSAYLHEGVPPPDVPACARVEDDRFAGAVLVGDSLADGLAIHGVTPKLQVLGRIGLSPRTALTDDTFKNGGKPVTLERKLPAMRPTAVYLWLGSNGLVSRSADEVLGDYSRLLNRLLAALPQTPFYLVEVTPVSTLSHERYAAFTNERIDAFNGGLRTLAARHGIYVLPVNALLKGDDGLLDAAYAAEDGIHLQESAYEALADYLYTHVLP